jgi:hypothetical protein
MNGWSGSQLHHAFRRALQALGLSLVLLAPACQAPPASLQVAREAAGSVNFTINVPKKVSKAVRHVQATGTESSTLLVNQVDVSLSGPGFYSPLYPPGTEQVKGEIAVQSGSISSRIDNVPTGRNRFIKVVAKNGQAKLNQVAGVLDVDPGPYNHVVVGLSTTPTANIIEKLGLVVPEVARTFSSKQLQYWLDTRVTKPVMNDPTKQNAFDGVHPYLVNADGIVSYLVANNYTLPTDFDLSRTADKAFVLNAGTVRVKLDAPLVTGSRIWLNDPTSAILETTAADAATTEFVIPNVAPNFERSTDDATPPTWTLAIMTPDGKLTSVPVAIARQPLSQGVLPEVVADLRGSLKAIKRIFLSPGDATWTGTTVALNGRKVQQLFVYAVYDDTAGEKIVPLLPNALTWDSLDTARLKVGNGGQLDGSKLSAAMQAADPNLAGLSLEDYGLVYPLAETDTTTPKASIRGTMKGNPALTATVDFTVGYLGAATGRVQIDVVADGLKVLPANQTIAAADAPVPLTVSEPLAPQGTTYRWVSDSPLISVGDGTGKSIAVTALGDLGSGKAATITVFSSTGRQTSTTVSTAFGTGTVSGSATAGSVTAKFDPLPGANAGNADVTANTGYPLGGYLNIYQGQASVSASDPADANAAFFWFSSDPFTIAVSGAFPSRTATLTALRPGTVTLTAMDAVGHTITTLVKSTFDRTGTVTGSLVAPDSPINLVGATTATIVTDLNSLFATKTYTAAERGTPGATFKWISLDPTRLVIDPPSGQSFPNTQATFKALRPGAVDFQVVSAATGQIRTFSVTLAFANGTATGSAKAPQLLVKTQTGTTITSYIGKTLGEIVTFQATDPSDASATLVWTSDTPTRAAVHSQSGNQVQVRVLDYGTTVIRVVNTRNGRWGLLTVDVQKTGKGNGTVNVTL